MANKTVFLLGMLLAVPALAQDSEPKPRVQNGADESIYVVQKRAFSKKQKFEITPLFFTALNPKFVGYVGGGLSVAYHLRENLAVELSTAIPGATHAFFSNLVEDVYAHENLAPEAVDLKRMKYFGTMNLQLSALYGKFRFSLFGFNTLIDYDAYVSAGLGAAQTVKTCDANRDGCSDIVGAGRGLKSPDNTGDRWKLAASLGGGMRFFFSNRFGLRLEVRDVGYSDRDTDNNKAVSTGIRNNVLFFLGLSALI